MTLVAHAGHWFVSLLYVVPVAGVVGALWVMSIRERRRDDDEDDADRDV